MIDERFEDKVLACMLRSAEFCTVSQRYIKPSCFTDNIRNNISKLLLEFYERYEEPLTDRLETVKRIKRLAQEGRLNKGSFDTADEIMTICHIQSNLPDEKRKSYPGDFKPESITAKEVVSELVKSIQQSVDCSNDVNKQ